MSDRLADIEARIESVRQLSAVISAMRGIAAARTTEANKHLEGVRAYAKTVAEAIGRGLVMVSEVPGVASETNLENGDEIVIALCAEQGFAGSFSDRILARGRDIMDKVAKAELMLVGDRGLLVAEEHGLDPVWSSAMIASTDQATLLANRIMDALYRRIEGKSGVRVTLIHAAPSTSPVLNILVKRLVPFDFSQFPSLSGRDLPEINLRPEVLLESLVEEYVFAELCEAVILSFAAENEARMRAMISAQENVSDTLDDLAAASRRQRQNEITDEIGELSASRLREN